MLELKTYLDLEIERVKQSLKVQTPFNDLNTICKEFKEMLNPLKEEQKTKEVVLEEDSEGDEDSDDYIEHYRN